MAIIQNGLRGPRAVNHVTVLKPVRERAQIPRLRLVAIDRRVKIMEHKTLFVIKTVSVSENDLHFSIR